MTLLNQLQQADRKFTDAAILINSLDAGHVSNRDGLQGLLDALGELDKKSSVKPGDITPLRDSIIAKFEENRTQIEEAKETFTTHYPKSQRMFSHSKNEDGSVRPSRRFATWRGHEFDDGGNLLEEDDVFERE